MTKAVGGSGQPSTTADTLSLVAGAVAAVIALAGCLGLLPQMLDDAYITYSVARNLARSGSLAYAPGMLSLSTTAPFYAVVLAAAWRLGLDIPVLSNVLGSASILGAALSVQSLCRRHGHSFAGAVAALLIASAPLLWLNLGMETCFQLMLVCAAFLAYDRERHALAAALLGLAVVTRADALVPAAVIAGHHLLIRRRHLPWVAAAVFVALLLPMAIFLQWSFGSPLPATLHAKRAQTAVGMTGFYVGTGFLEGIAIMLRGWVSQCWLYLIWVPMLLLGLMSARRLGWAWGLVAWAALHITSYAVLGVAPYTWYYAPLAPAAALVAGLAAQWLASRARSAAARLLLGGAPVACLLIAQLVSLGSMVCALHGSLPPHLPVQDKVLPAPDGSVRRAAGQWLNAHARPDARIAIGDVGIVGYFADRPMVDFLGLLEPDIARALERGDLTYALPHYMPDYVVLGADLSTFGVGYAGDPWFHSTYRVVERVVGDGQADPLLIAERLVPPAPLQERRVDLTCSAGLVLQSYAVESPATVGQGLRLRLDWLRGEAASPPATVQVYLNDPLGNRVAWHDISAPHPLWPVAELVPTYVTFFLDKGWPAGLYTLGVRHLVRGQAQVDHVLGPLPVAGDRQFVFPPIRYPLDVAFGSVARLKGYDVERRASAADDFRLVLYWQAINKEPVDTSFTVFTHLLDRDGRIVAQHDGMPVLGTAPTSAWVEGQTVVDPHDLVFVDRDYRGEVSIEVGLYDLATMQRLSTATGEDRVTLPTTITVGP